MLWTVPLLALAVVLARADCTPRADVTVVSNVEGLLAIGDSLCSRYELAADISLSDPWEPLGVFTGVLNGRGFKISNLRLAAGEEGTGLFSALEGATVVDLSLELAGSVEASGAVGGLAGAIRDSQLSGLRVSGSLSVSGAVSAVGGIAGTVQVDGALTDLYSNLALSVSSSAAGLAEAYAGTLFGAVTATAMEHFSAGPSASLDASLVADVSYVGGLVGAALGDDLAALRNSDFLGQRVSATGSAGLYAGGLVGLSGSLADCESRASLSASASANLTAGGVAGEVRGPHPSIGVSMRGAEVKVTADPAAENSNCTVGGAIGHAVDSPLVDAISYARVDAVANSLAEVGGLVGCATANLHRCYTFSELVAAKSSSGRAKAHVGGLVGRLQRSSISNANYLNTIDCLANVTEVRGEGEFNAVVGGFMGIYLNTDSAPGRVTQCSAFTRKITGINSGDVETAAEAKIHFSTVGGFVGSSTNADFYLMQSMHNSIYASSVKGNVSAGGFCGECYDTTFNHGMMDVKELTVDHTASDKYCFAKVGGFAGGLSGLFKVKYIGSFITSLNVTSSSEYVTVGGFCGAVDSAAVESSFSRAAVNLKTSANYYNVRVGGLVGDSRNGEKAEMVMIRSSWSDANVTVDGMGQSVHDEASGKGIIKGGFGLLVGSMSGKTFINSTYTTGKLRVFNFSDVTEKPKCALLVGMVYNGNLTANIMNGEIDCVGGTDFQAYEMAGMSNNWLGGFNNFYNHERQGVASPDKFVDDPEVPGIVIPKTLAQLADASTYKDADGKPITFFDFTADRNWWRKYNDAEMPVFENLPNICQAGSPEDAKAGNFCIYVEFNNMVFISDDRFYGQPYLAPPHIKGAGAAESCPAVSDCRGRYLDPMVIECADGFTGANCDKCSSDEGCQNGGSCSSGTCTCAAGWEGVDCARGRCPADESGLCMGVGSCGEAATGFYLCSCPSPAYMVENQLCTFACPFLENGKCLGLPTNDNSNLLCYAGYSPDTYCNSGPRDEGRTYSSGTLAGVTVFLVIVILALVGVLVWLLVSRKRKSYASMESEGGMKKAGSVGMTHVGSGNL